MLQRARIELILQIFLWWCGLALVACPRVWPAESSPTTAASLEQAWKALSRTPASEIPLDIEGTVTFCSPQDSILFVQEGSRSARFELPGGHPALEPGEQLRIRGSANARSFKAIEIEPLGQRLPLTPLHPRAADLASGKYTNSLADLTVSIRTIRQYQGQLKIDAIHEGVFLDIIIPQFTTTNFLSFLDATATMRGVLGERLDHGGTPFYRFWVQSWDTDVRILQTAEHFTFPLMSIASAAQEKMDRINRKRVRVRGTVTRGRDRNHIIVDDGTGTIEAFLRYMDGPLFIGDQVEICGFPGTNSAGLVLKYALSRWVPGGKSSTAPTTSKASTPAEITRIGRLKFLDPEADKGIPVNVRGTVTFSDSRLVTLFVQDESGGVFVSTAINTPFKAGDIVEVRGTTDPGGFAPVIHGTSVDKIGAGPMPPARRVTTEQLLTGQEDSQWVEIEGIVQAISTNLTRTVLTVVSGSGRFAVEIPALKQLPVHLVDSLVRFRGAVGAISNRRRQLRGVTLYCPGLEYVQLLTSGSSNPFRSPATRIGQIGQFKFNRDAGHRIHVSGMVTYYQPGHFLYLQDDTGGVRVETAQISDLLPGDMVDVIGFPEAASSTPSLRHGYFRRLSREQPPLPERVEASEVLEGRSIGNSIDARFVEVEGTVLERARLSGGESLVLEDDSRIFYCLLPGEDAHVQFANLRNGSRVRLAGICSLELDEEETPKSFTIMLRNPEDLEVVEEPSWWTAQRTAVAAGGLSLVAMMAAAWGVTLRRRVHTQTQLLRERYDRETALSRLSNALSAVHSPQDAASLLLSQAQDFMDLDAGRVDLLSNDLTRYHPLLTVRFSMEKGLPLLHKDFSELVPPNGTHTEPVTLQLEEGERDAGRFAIYVPIRSRQRSVGGFLLITRPGQKLAGDTLQLLQTIAERSGTALERIRAEQVSRQNEERFRYAVKATSDIIWDWDILTNQLSWSDGFHKLLGCSPAEIKHELSFWLGRIHPDDVEAVEESVEKAVAGREEYWTSEYRLRRNDGSYVYVLDRGYVIRDSGKAIRMIGAVLDLTARKQVELQLKQAKVAAERANKAKGDFLATMSHEIRTPMNGIMGMTNLLLATELTDEQKDYAETVRDSSEALLTIINDILDFSKIEAGKITLENLDFDLRHVVEDVVALVGVRSGAKQVEISSFIMPETHTLFRGDPGRIRQILLNLAGNAIKFTETGEVFVSVGVSDETAERATVHIEVSDTGIGIAQDVIESLFQPFTQGDSSTTRKYGGSGLGLIISKRLVEQMGGEIGVRSTVGKGSTFWIKVPLVKQQRKGNTAEGPGIAGLRLLLIDESGKSEQAFRQLLTSWQVRHSRSDLAGAIPFLEAEARAGRGFDVVILDLPESAARDTAGRLRNSQLLSRLWIILLSGDRNLSFESMRQAGIEECLPRPLRPSELYNALASAKAGRDILRARPRNVERDSADASDRPRIRLLIAEDNIVNQKVALKQLQRLGYDADIAANGAEVIEAVERQFYPLILMDCHMPVLDGYETTMRIRQKESLLKLASPVRIIALTADAMQGEREKCIRCGMDDYISKPVRIEVLKAMLEKHLQSFAFADNSGRLVAARIGDSR